MGNVEAIDDLNRGTTYDQTFGYDEVDRLTSVTGFGAETYTYDARGNRLTKGSATYSYTSTTDRLTSDGTTSFTHNGVGSVLTAGTQTYTYTPFQMQATATVGSGTTTYGYDGDKQRRLRVLASGTKEYFVPGPGLVPLAEYRKASGGSRVHIYAGDRLIASVGLEPAPLASVTWTDDPIVAGVTDVKAVHLTELRTAINAARTAHGLSVATWTDATVAPGVTVIQAVHLTELRTAINAVYTAAGVTPLTYTDPTLTVGVTAVRAVHLTELRAARTNAPAAEVTATRFYHVDALGSVRAVTDTSGTTVRRHDYAPFGEEPSPAAGADSRRFTGKERDTETGLDYFSARYYGAGSGRFTTVDPYNILGEAEDEADLIAYLSAPQRWNRYGNALANPLKFKDPDGKNPLLVGAAIGALSFGGWKALQNVLNDRPVLEGVAEQTLAGALAGATLGLVGPVIAGIETASAGTAAASVIGNSISFTRGQLQHGFKHAADFGISGNPNNRTLAELRSAIEAHVAAPTTAVIVGTFRRNPVTHFVNPTTGLNVIRDANGKFLTGYRLNLVQLGHLLTTGNLGGG